VWCVRFAVGGEFELPEVRKCLLNMLAISVTGTELLSTFIFVGGESISQDHLSAIQVYFLELVLFLME